MIKRSQGIGAKMRNFLNRKRIPEKIHSKKNGKKNEKDKEPQKMVFLFWVFVCFVLCICYPLLETTLNICSGTAKQKKYENAREKTKLDCVYLEMSKT